MGYPYSGTCDRCLTPKACNGARQCDYPADVPAGTEPNQEDLAVVYRGLVVAAMRNIDATVRCGAYVGGFSPSDGHSQSAFVVMERQSNGAMLLIDEQTEKRP